MTKRYRYSWLVFGSSLFVGISALALSPEDKCEATKNKVAGKYAFCRQKAESKAIKKGIAADFSKCDAKLGVQWTKAEAKAVKKGTSCTDNVSSVQVQAFVTTHTAAVATGLDGGGLPECGDGSVNAVGEQCDGGDLGGENCSSLGFQGGAIACTVTCGFDTSGCAQGGVLPATGQTISFGAGTDGDVEAGPALSYTDNGDGTITDNNTGLIWEKKGDAGDVNDKDNTYTWCGPSCGATYVMDGTVKTSFLDTLNDVSGGGSNCFADFCDWRIPNAKEIATLLDYTHGVGTPLVDSAFHTATCTGCTNVKLANCSCTATTSYLSSTSQPTSASTGILAAFFDNSYVQTVSKSLAHAARAVRGGV